MKKQNVMVAFHGDKKVKVKYLARVEAHQKADEIMKGFYWKDGKGCAVGCTIEGSDHSKYETELGIPRQIAYLEDGIFENIPNGKAKQFPLKFISAISVGADLSLVTAKFVVWCLVNKKDGVIKFAKDDAGKKIIQDVADLYTKKIEGSLVTEEDWKKVENAAYAAYASAAYASAASAAYARTKFYEKMADKLIELLKKAK